MKIFYDVESEQYITIEELRQQYEELKEAGETEADSFEEYLDNCMTKNNGALDYNKYSMDDIKEIAEDFNDFIESNYTKQFDGDIFALLTEAQEEKTAEGLQGLKNYLETIDGYAWEKVALEDFINDMEALQELASQKGAQRMGNDWNTPEEIAKELLEMARDFDTDTEQEPEVLKNITAELEEMQKKETDLYYCLRFITTEQQEREKTQCDTI